MAKRKRDRISPPAKLPAAPDQVHAERPAVAGASRSVRVLCLLAGLILPQLVLLGSSLWGGTILLPLDILASENIYLPRESPDAASPVAKDSYLSDLVFQAEPFRRLAVDEVRAGRWPLWNPYSYAGHPLLAANQPQAFSPYRMLDYVWPSPLTLAWQAMLRALVIGVGTYLFFRRSMSLHWLAAAIAAWGMPLTGPMVLHSGFSGVAVLSFLPWLLLAADAAACRPRAPVVAGLAIATAFTLLAGHAAFAGQVLLIGGVYFLARLIHRVGIRQIHRRLAWPSLLTGAFGVFLGFLLSAPQTLPTVDYLRSSLRIANRQVIGEETPPSGPSAVLQMVLPYAFGSTQQGSQYVGGAGNRIESAVGGYAGLLFALVLAPLGWADASRRWWMVFWTIVIILGVTPTFGIPVLSLLFEVPPVSMLRNNRLVFAAALALLAMSAIGLNAMITDPASLRRWPARVAAGMGALPVLLLGGWCLNGIAITPIGDETGSIDVSPLAMFWPESWAAATGGDLLSWFGLMYRNGLLLCTIALAAIGVVQLIIARRPASSTGPATVLRTGLAMAIVLGLLATVEMVSMSAGVNVRADPSLYYPRLAWMDAIADKPGRICGYGCFPANLSIYHGQHDIRGYDAADPVPIVELVLLARAAGQEVWPPWAVTQFLTVDPKNPAPVAKLLGVRHIVGRGQPPAGVTPWWSRDDYWLVENAGALPRVTLPREIRVAPEAASRMATLGSASHDPAAVALLEIESTGVGAAVGSVRIVEDLPNRVRIEADLTRGGIVRLADAWDAGWRATYNGQPVELLRADHALRAVVVPAGSGIIEFEYAPQSFRWGLNLAAVGGLGVLVSLLKRPNKRRDADPADVYLEKSSTDRRR